MAYIVGENCIRCRYTDCVGVCPVDCFKAGPNFLVIDPEECIDCAVCVPECPAEAIYAENDVPDNQKHYIELNRELAKAWPYITQVETALPDADQWNGVTNKLQYLDRGQL